MLSSVSPSSLPVTRASANSSSTRTSDSLAKVLLAELTTTKWVQYRGITPIVFPFVYPWRSDSHCTCLESRQSVGGGNKKNFSLLSFCSHSVTSGSFSILLTPSLCLTIIIIIHHGIPVNSHLYSLLSVLGYACFGPATSNPSRPCIGSGTELCSGSNGGSSSTAFSASQPSYLLKVRFLLSCLKKRNDILNDIPVAKLLFYFPTLPAHSLVLWLVIL